MSRRATLEELIEGRVNSLVNIQEELAHQVDLYRLSMQWLKQIDLLLVKYPQE